MGEIIYLIDDESSVVKSLSRLLRLYDFDVHGFHAADAFLAAYQPDAHCCIILDLVLPNMEGFALQQEIHARTPGRPIILLSGSVDVPKSVEAMKADAMDFLTKPVDAPDLHGSCCARRGPRSARSDVAPAKSLNAGPGSPCANRRWSLSLCHGYGFRQLRQPLSHCRVFDPVIGSHEYRRLTGWTARARRKD